MKSAYLFALVALLNLPLSAELAAETFYGQGFNKITGKAALKGIENVCYATKIKVTTVDSEGSAKVSKEDSETLRKSIVKTIEPFFIRAGFPALPCTNEDLKSSQMAMLLISVSLKPENKDRNLYRIVVETTLSEVLAVRSNNKLVRVNLLSSYNFNMSRAKGESGTKSIQKLALKDSAKQVNWTTNTYLEAREE